MYSPAEIDALCQRVQELETEMASRFSDKQVTGSKRDLFYRTAAPQLVEIVRDVQRQVETLTRDVEQAREIARRWAIGVPYSARDSADMKSIAAWPGGKA